MLLQQACVCDECGANYTTIEATRGRFVCTSKVCEEDHFDAMLDDDGDAEPARLRALVDIVDARAIIASVRSVCLPVRAQASKTRREKVF